MEMKIKMFEIREKKKGKKDETSVLSFSKPYPSSWILMADGWDLGRTFCLFICFHYRQMKHLEGTNNKTLGGNV